MTTFRKRYSLTFRPHPLGRGCVCGPNICYHDAASVVSFNLICNMTTFRIKDIVWPFDPTPWVQGVSVGKIFATMLLPASSALIWYATWPYSEKSLILTLAPPSNSIQQARTQAFKLESCWYVSYLLLLCLYAKCQQKILTIALVIVKK